MEKPRKEVKWYEKLDAEEVRKPPKTSNSISKKPVNKFHLFDQNVKDAYQWIDKVAFHLHLQERKGVALKVLREGLHIIRDRITINEVLHLSAQLPVIVRGIYFESYTVKGKPDKFHVEAVEDRMHQVLMGTKNIIPQQAFAAVLKTLYENISEGELQDIRGTLPKDIREYWDECISKSQAVME